MSNINDIYSEITQLFETFQEEHLKFVEKGNLSAGMRARGAINQLKKLITPYKKLSTEKSKEIKSEKKNSKEE